jgi:hypothetical protein
MREADVFFDYCTRKRNWLFDIPNLFSLPIFASLASGFEFRLREYNTSPTFQNGQYG